MKLAINGGTPVRTEPFPAQITTGAEEKEALNKLMDDGRLTGYRGNWIPEFYGGEQVKELEKEFQEYFHVKHAIACNSATSGLHITLRALNIASRFRVVVSPYSMSCSATAPLMTNAYPLFADVEEEYQCISLKSVKEVTEQGVTAIIPVSIFGQPYDIKINDYAEERGAWVIEDAAQAIGSKAANGRFAGTLGDVGIFSFNFGKIISCGEGGMMLTDNDDIAIRLRLVMNHAEAVVSGMTPLEMKAFDNLDNYNNWRKYTLPDITRLVGYNMRMTEMQAAILRCQLRKLDTLVNWRQISAKILGDLIPEATEGACRPYKTREGSTNSYYCQAFKFDAKKAGVHRDRFIEAVKAELTPRKGREGEGVAIGCGYIQPLYRMPLFKSWNIKASDYPVVERLWKDELFLHQYLAYPTSAEDLDSIVEAFAKVWESKEEL